MYQVQELKYGLWWARFEIPNKFMAKLFTLQIFLGDLIFKIVIVHTDIRIIFDY